LRGVETPTSWLIDCYRGSKTTCFAGDYDGPHRIGDPVFNQLVFHEMGKRGIFNGSYGGFLKSEYPQLARWFRMENPKITWMITRGTPMTMETSIICFTGPLLNAY